MPVAVHLSRAGKTSMSQSLAALAALESLLGLTSALRNA